MFKSICGLLLNSCIDSISGTSQAFFSVPQATEVIDSMSFPGMESGGNILGTFDLGSSWISAPNNMDWVRIAPPLWKSSRLDSANFSSSDFLISLSRTATRPRQRKRARPRLDGEGTADGRHGLGYSTQLARHRVTPRLCSSLPSLLAAGYETWAFACKTRMFWSYLRLMMSGETLTANAEHAGR